MRTIVVMCVASAMSAAAQAQAVPDSLAADTVSPASAIVALSRAARDGPRKLAELRGLPLEDSLSFTLTLPVPASWSCRLQLARAGGLVTVLCSMRLPADVAEAEFDRLAELLSQHVHRRGWAKENRVVDAAIRSGAPIERAVAYVFRRDLRPIAGMALSTRRTTRRNTAEAVILLSVRSYPRPDKCPPGNGAC